MSKSRFGLAALVLFLAGSPSVFAQWQPGDVFRDYVWRSIYAWQRVTGPDAIQQEAKQFLPNPINDITIGDLTLATRVEVQVELLQSHAGTINPKLRVNGNAWIDIPPASAIPGIWGRGGDPNQYQTMLYPTVAVPLAQVKVGINSFEMTCQGTGGSYIGRVWPQFLIYGVTFRVYYDPSKPHPTGSITTPTSGGRLGDAPTIEALAQGPNPIRRVEFLGDYDDFNWRGDGLRTGWQYALSYGALHKHVGTATEAPWRVTWNTAWVPIQGEPFRLCARIVDTTGLVYVTPAVGDLKLRRSKTIIRHRATNVPQAWASRDQLKHTCDVTVTDDLTKAEAARLFLVTWHGVDAAEVGINDTKVVGALGRNHDIDWNFVDVPIGLVKAGKNVPYTYSISQEHGIEVQWPGIELFVRFAVSEDDWLRDISGLNPYPHHVMAFQGSTGGERFGAAVAMLGDVDGDGVGDLAASAPGAFPVSGVPGRVLVHSGANGKLLKTLTGGALEDQFGWSLAALGDVDGDLVPDLAVGAPFEDAGAANTGAVHVFSGKTWTLLHRFTGVNGNEILGISVDGGHDIDRDGRPDIVCGGHGGSANGPLSGVVRVYSGRTGSEIWHHDGDSPRDFLGHALASVGDIDKDGWPDVLVGVPDDDDAGDNSGSARLLSGKDGSILRRFDADASKDNFGHWMVAPGDVDGDGWIDLAIAAPSFNPPRMGYVRVYSGKTGATLHTFRSAEVGDWFGEKMDAAGDWNGDGHADLLVGLYANDAAAFDGGLVRVYSGKDGSILQTFSGGGPAASFGYSVRLGGDLTGDGKPELVVGAPLARQGTTELGRVYLISSVPQTLVADGHALSLPAGGVQVLNLFAGAANAGKLYMFVGSMSGVSPGIQFPDNGPLLRLNFDDYMLATVMSPNLFVVPSIGVLDGAGLATTKFVLLAGLPATLDGLVLHHAYLTIDLTRFKVQAASNPIPTRFFK